MKINRYIDVSRARQLNKEYVEKTCGIDVFFKDIEIRAALGFKNYTKQFDINFFKENIEHFNKIIYRLKSLGFKVSSYRASKPFQESEDFHTIIVSW